VSSLRRKSQERVARLLGVGVLVCAATALVSAGDAPVPLRRVRLDCVVSSSLFRSVSRNDATAALRVWAGLVGQKYGFQVDPSVTVSGEFPDLRKRIQTGTAGLMAMDILEYLGLADLPAAVPVFQASRNERGDPQGYVLVVRASSGISTLEGLRGKSVIVQASTAANLGQIWLGSMLFDSHLSRPDRFFRSIEPAAKATSAILPVFFGKADAAVVENAGFAVTGEMNPQIGVQLRILVTSPPLSEGLVCVRPKSEFREELIEGLRELYLDVQGRQILTVFRCGRLMPVDKPAIDRVRDMWRKHNLLCGTQETVSREPVRGETP
jgi:ABC-type phosphate/phosphonate transport system substrate-binding protein